MEIKVDIPWNLFVEATKRAASRAVRALAFDIKEQAHANIRGGVAAHVRKSKINGKWEIETVTDLIDTGALFNSLYVITGTGYTERPASIAAAMTLQPGVPFGTPDPAPRNHLEARCAVAVEYGTYVEALYPYLQPAVGRSEAKAEMIMTNEMRKEGL
jgi:hypothetical protein